MKTTKELLQLIKSYYWEHAPYYKNLTFEPMTDAQINDFEATVGFMLDADLRTFLGTCDYRIDFDGNYSYEKADMALREWNVTDKLVSDGTFDGWVELKEKNGFTNWNDKRLKRTYCSKKWIPLAVDGCGNQICIDHEPGVQGQHGQIIFMEFQDGQGPYYVMESLRDYLEFTYECLINNQWTTWDYWEEGNKLIEIDSYIKPRNHKTDNQNA